jgi:hypothetical protein
MQSDFSETYTFVGEFIGWLEYIKHNLKLAVMSECRVTGKRK